MHYLILPCSKRKRDPATLFNHVLINGQPMAPAWSVYDGNQTRLARRELLAAPRWSDLTVVFLSARYGLVWPDAPIPNYDEALTRERATDRFWVRQRITEVWGTIVGFDAHTVTYAFGGLYEQALMTGLRPFTALTLNRLAPHARGQGDYLAALRDFFMALKAARRARNAATIPPL